MASAILSNIRHDLSKIELSTLGIPMLVLLIISMLILPLPAMLLDFLFTFNIILGLVIIMVAINSSKPLDFSSFPSILLLATMLRLGLNVASTRLVLVKGHEGPDAAGKVIEAFGEFVIDGNYLVGFIIFSILMIINFIVVTKGAGRVSEVIARFTLDAMPGKQMSIDADLNAGVIDQETAKRRREEISQESDFFGSMDGASKFVRGDAVAGLLILVINIIGGLIIGIGQHDMSFSDAGRIYVLLTIGDGLVAQIPSLLLSLATAIIVTRVTTSESMAEQAKSQLNNPLAFFVAAGILILLGLVPGMPHLMFLSLGMGAAVLGYLMSQDTQKRALDVRTEAANAKTAEAKREELGWDDVDQVDLVGLDIGYGLIPLVNPDTGGQLLPRVKGVRKKLSAELGFLIQPIRIRDNLDLAPDVYHIVMNGVVRGKGTIKVGREMAINPGQVHGKLEGTATKEPAFGLEAVWIDPSQRDYARTLGYTVVDAATAIATHLNTLLRSNSSELLSHDETQQLLDKVSARAPKLVEDLVPGKLPLATITKVLQNILDESVSVRDMRTIIEVLSTESARTQDADELTAAVRPRLGRMIVQGLVEINDSLPVITLEPSLEQMLHNVLQQSSANQGLIIEPKLAEGLFKALAENTADVENQGLPAVLVVSPGIRPWLSKIIRHRLSDLTVLSYSEIPEDQAVKVVATVSIADKQ
ncbi:MAG: flagellar biosynthesis protein FlhA [Porticoccaceae bacterium]|jgi:flagellar biosynthesis protein FlhA|nr:flagellar biosynthesis protein FlhA [Alphaproteobacteria bacterium]MDP4744409.1 flagellar biosynthesis protein FlhA [Porticoccaceae bacterium]MDP4752977.1 flagellar biosynthesis protein FlhA [Porticoccaceae bacterium]MDP4890091.1 flagellar biosynthesis protein FlhA [Porticoccaceae bacterium]MDP5051056.1 flagellar biosynthesis protein FlhA [Porticoccaceae bacterium]|tara:strand:- start:14278 stop:16383 length:2106 start_codon:yes stop_codon:yes gene_type:complete